ncbi:PBIP1 protein, partial [Dicaeum eximium]|nr:PBIP1 protein [Dicaeum eximium]
GPVESWDLADGEQESLLSIDSNDSQPDAGGPQSMQSMSQLLDKLAKENQEIRLMQAELQVGAQCHVSVLCPGAALPLSPLSQPPPLLQAHKEDLQALLHKSEGEVAAAGAQQQSLAAENAQLRA